jgi:hypothetical protein
MSPRIARPETPYYRMVEDALRAGAPGSTVNPQCISIELEREQRFPKMTWEDGLALDRGHEAWGFCIGPYWNHVMGCHNTAHLEPCFVETYYPKHPVVQEEVRLVKQNPARPIDSPFLSLWNLRQAVIRQQALTLSTLNSIRAELAVLDLPEIVERPRLNRALQDLGMHDQVIEQSLESLQAWGAITLEGNGIRVVRQVASSARTAEQ